MEQKKSSENDAVCARSLLFATSSAAAASIRVLGNGARRSSLLPSLEELTGRLALVRHFASGVVKNDSKTFKIV
jgi:hypothetical protein